MGQRRFKARAVCYRIGKELIRQRDIEGETILRLKPTVRRQVFENIIVAVMLAVRSAAAIASSNDARTGEPAELRSSVTPRAVMPIAPRRSVVMPRSGQQSKPIPQASSHRLRKHRQIQAREIEFAHRAARGIGAFQG